MRPQPGDHLGPYIVEALIGSGGMGDVYRGRDTRLGRLVAIKVIAGGRDEREESRARFAAEGRAVAALEHPHICALYDTGIESGRPYLVMEYLEGETLAERLARGTPPLRDILRIAIEVADALGFAHRRGIIHRDLKPANVFLKRSSGAKLLDFGLATMREAAVGDPSGLATEPLSVPRPVAGTVHYMAPELLDGKPADARSDIYALGAVIYEMLAGKRAFDEPTQARLMSAILHNEPAPLPQSAVVPPELTTLAMTLLCKDPDDRWQSVHDVARVLRGLASNGTALGAASHRTTAPRRVWPVLAAAAVLAVAGLAALVVWNTRTAPGAPPPVSFLVPPPAGGMLGMTSATVPSAQLAVSPDGTMLALVAAGRNGREQLFVRKFDEAEPQPQGGTDGASYPFWSPDSRQVGFFADGQLKTIAVSGGPHNQSRRRKTDGAVHGIPGVRSSSHRTTTINCNGSPCPNARRHRWPPCRLATPATAGRSSFPTGGASCSWRGVPIPASAGSTSCPWTTRRIPGVCVTVCITRCTHQGSCSTSRRGRSSRSGSIWIASNYPVNLRRSGSP